MITYPPGSTRRGQHIFPECVSEQAFGSWIPTKGELHKLLQKGEYNITGDAPIFEGTFVQVTKRGECVGILNHPNIVIVGILASTPTMLLPDLMIIARDKKEERSQARKLEIARLIPLELVDIYVHNLKERRLKIHMATGRNYYLQLCAPDGEEGFLFERWMRLIYLLHMASGKVDLPANVSSKDVGLHTIWKTASMPSETQYWLPAIMDKGSSEELKKRSSPFSSTRMEQKSKQSAVASKQTLPKSGVLQPSSQQVPGTRLPAAYTSGQQPRDSVSKDPSQLKSKSAAMPSEQETRPQSRRFSTIKSTPHSPFPSCVSVGVETSKFDTKSMGIGPSVPFTVSEAAGPTQPPSRLSTRESIQRQSGQQSGVPAVPENVVHKGSITTARESSESAEIPIKLERSEKSRSLVQTAASQLTQQKVSQSRSNAPSLKERSAAESRVTSQGSKLSEKQQASVPPSGVQSQGRTSAPYSQMVCMYNEAQGDMGSRPVSRAMSVKSKPSGKQQPSVPPSGVPSQGRTSAPYSQMAGMNEEPEGDMESRPVSRAMSVKSKPSEKQQPSAPPSGVPSQGRTSAPYSQMAGMNEEADGDMGSRPVSRAMSVKSKPSEKQQPSAPPSGVPSQGRTSAPYSQMAGMNEEADGDMGSRPVSRAMSVKSKPSEKQQPSVPPSGVPSQGRSLMQTAPSQLTQQKVSQSQSYAPSFKEKSSTEAQVISQGSSRSARPLTPEERGGLASQRSSRWQSQPASRAASTRAPSGSAAARSRISEAVGSSDAYTRSVAVGPSGTTSVAAGPSQAPSQGSRVVSAKSTASRPPPFLASQPASDAFRQPSAKSNATVDVCSIVWDGANEEGDGAARTAPVSRAMSVKSKPSEKQQPSILPSGVQSQGPTSAPYSQMAGMNAEAEEDMGSRPVSRAMSVKSKPSGRQQPSIPPSGVQSQGRTSAPYSQMAGLNAEAEEDMGSRPISRAMSVKSKPSEKQQPSVPPSGVQSRGQTSAPYSQMASMNAEAEEDMGSRPISRAMSVRSQPSGRQQPSVPPSGVPSQGRSSMQTAPSQLTQQKVSQSQSYAPSFKEKSSTEAQVISQGSSRSARPLTPEERGGLASQRSSRGQSQPASRAASTRAPSGSAAARSRLSEAVGSSDAYARSEAVGPSGATSVAAGPSQAASQASRGASAKSYSPMGGKETQKPSKTKSGRKGGPQLERNLMSVAVGPSEPQMKTVAAGPSQPFPGTQSRPQSRTADPAKSVNLKTIFSRKKTTSGDKTQPSSPTERQVSPREKASKSKSRLKNALSSAKQRSSLTFVTIYSVMSSSLERLRRSKSNEEDKFREQQLQNIASKASKRVTISGVIGPSGKSIQTEPVISSELSAPMENEFGSTTATLGSDPGHLSALQSFTETSQPSVASNRGVSASSKLDGGTSDPIMPSSRPSEKRALSNEPSVNTGGLPPRSKTSVDTRTSAAGINPAIAGSSTSRNRREQGPPSWQSQQQSQMEENWIPSLQPSTVARPPDRSRISVGVGRSVVGTKSEAVGPSVRGSLRDAAVGPSTTGSWKQRGESHVQSRQQSQGEDRWRPSSQPSVRSELLSSHPSRPPDRSRISVGVGRSVVETQSEAVGPSVRGSWRDTAVGPSTTGGWKQTGESRVQSRQQSQGEDGWRPSSQPSAMTRTPDRSLVSVGVGRSVVETQSEAVGPSVRGSWRDTAVGPSTVGGWKQKGESRVQSRQQNQGEDGWRPSSQPSAMTRTPDRSLVSVGVGRSVVETQSEAVGPSVRGSWRDTAVGPSTVGGWKQRGESRVQSRQQSQGEDGWRPSSQPSAMTRTPDRSLVSVGVGRSVVETQSEAVGPSVRGSWRDTAVGPSTVGGWKQRGESRVQSRQQSQGEDGWRPSSQPSAMTRTPDRSLVSVGVGRSAVETKSAAAGPSTTASWKEQQESKMHSQRPSQMDDTWRLSSQPSVRSDRLSSHPSRPPDRSRMSVGVGRSLIETKSVGVGRSQKEVISEGAGPSKPASRIIARTPRNPESRLQEHSVLQPQGWLGTIETEDSPVFRTTAASPAGPSQRASRATAPSGGFGSRVTPEASTRSYT